MATLTVHEQLTGAPVQVLQPQAGDLVRTQTQPHLQRQNRHVPTGRQTAPGDRHWAFEGWGRFLPDHSTAVSLLDRLLHHNHVVVTDGESYRMRQARGRSGGRPSKH